MRLINNNFENIENFENFGFDTFIKEMTKYIASFNLEEDEVTQIYDDLLNTIIEYTNGKEYVTKYNGVINRKKYPSYAGAFHALIDQIKTDSGFKIYSGVVLRSNIRNNLHIFTHEFFHASATKRILIYKNDVLYTKGGFCLNYWDQKDNLINQEYNFAALNEGITEMLTQGFLNNKGKNNYIFQVVIAKLLSKYDPTIIKAYFSREETAIISFYNRFNELQSIMESRDFANLSQFIIYDQDLIYKVLKACIKYNINYCKKMDIIFEKEWITELVSQLDNDINYSLNDNSYTEIVNTIFNEELVNIGSK